MTTRLAQRARARSWSIVAVLIAIGIWELVGRIGATPFIPPLSRVIEAMPSFYSSAAFRQSLGQSLTSLAIGYGLAIVIGVSLGVIVALNRVAYWIVSPYITFFLTAPKPTLAPVLIVIFGLGPQPVVIIIFLYCFFFIVLNTIASVRAVPKELEEMARTFGGRRGQVLVKIVLPHALPLALAGIRLGGGLSVKGLVLGTELIAAIGIGALINKLTLEFQIVDFYAAMIAITLVGVLIMAAVGMLEHRLSPVKTQVLAIGGGA